MSSKIFPEDSSCSTSLSNSCKANLSNAAAEAGDKAITLEASTYRSFTHVGISAFGSLTGHVKGCTISSLCQTVICPQCSHFENSHFVKAASEMTSPANRRTRFSRPGTDTRCAETSLSRPYHFCFAVTSQYGHVKTSIRYLGVIYVGIENLYSHSMASVLPSRHSSYTQFSASTRNACRRMTRCRVSSASGTKAGTTSKTFFKLRALSFCFCPKVRGGSPLEARWRRKRPF